MRNYFYLEFLFCLGLVPHCILCIKLNDVTVDLFHAQAGGIVAAFGDFNADKLTDIFILDNDGTQIDLLEAQLDDPFIRRNLTSISGSGSVITSVMPADFDGDSFMDILVTRQPKGKHKDPVHVQIFWGSNQSPGIDVNTTLSGMLFDQPALVDWNGDMLPDLLGETDGRQRTVWLSSKDRRFAMVPIGENLTPFYTPQSNAFIDIDNDYNAEIIMTTEKSYEVWRVKGNNFTQNDTYDLPTTDKNAIIGQSSFVDIDQDGSTDHLVPVCMDKACAQSVIYWYNKAQAQWHELVSGFTEGDVQWGFVPPEDNLDFGTIPFPITLRTGDYNMDGVPDAIVILKAKDSTGTWLQKAVLLQNVPCSGTDCSPNGRTFAPDWRSYVSDFANVTTGSFFDLYENGVLDMLLVSMTTKPHGTSYYPQIRAIKQTSTTDACFVKVLVTSGLCYKDCPNGRPPYGVNVPGPAVKYKTTSVNGDEIHSCAGQLSQSSHFALQLPFTLFGLGQTPNFIDQIRVGVPTTTGEKLEKTWTQIIPNSQLVVIPHPHNKTAWWVMKLFATPSRLVLITGAVLIGTMGFVAGIIGILHWRERREDMKEKRQESHKFHFDAM